MPKVYMYVVDRDFGFAPNPFHGTCTLATCKPDIRRVAAIGDWVVGMGGGRLKATGRCIYAMRVTGSMSFNEYWSDPEFRCKRPIRNGSRRTMVGDSIYHTDADGRWLQEDSHHSRPDGTPDMRNIVTDTSTDRILLSHYFVYFGREAPAVPSPILAGIGYRNVRRHRTFKSGDCTPLLEWLAGEMRGRIGLIVADPFDFDHSAARYSSEQNRILA